MCREILIFAIACQVAHSQRHGDQKRVNPERCGNLNTGGDHTYGATKSVRREDVPPNYWKWHVQPTFE